MPVENSQQIKRKILKNHDEIKTLKQKIKERTATIRKLKDYRKKVKIAEEWDAELGAIIVDEAHRVGIDLAVALGMLETETGPFPNKNIFGCDGGGLFCNNEVDRPRVEQLLDHIERGGNSNGIGPSQITWPPYIYDAEEEGGAENPRYSTRVGFRILKVLVEKYGVQKAYIYYNGGEGSNDYYAVNTYAPRAMAHYNSYKEKLGE